jgi:DNA-binding XRE family transcriptional regulator
MDLDGKTITFNEGNMYRYGQDFSYQTGVPHGVEFKISKRGDQYALTANGYGALNGTHKDYGNGCLYMSKEDVEKEYHYQDVNFDLNIFESLRIKEAIIDAKINFEECGHYQAYLNQATTDTDLAIYYVRRDIILGLKRERMAQDISRSELAKKIGVNESDIEEFEQYNPKFTTIPFIVKYAMGLNKKVSIQIGENTYEDTSIGR